MGIDFSDYCNCEFASGPGGRIDSNQCPIHDMPPEEQLYWGVLGWREVTALEAENAQLREALENIANHPHSTYSSVSQYDIGVVDGHRCAASIARAVLNPQPAGTLPPP